MIALLMVLPWIASLLDPTFAHAGNFTIGLMLTTFVSGALLLSGYTSRRHRANGIELLLIMVLYWTLLPAIAAIPFIGASQIDSLVAAYFEAVSAITTSGATMLAVPQAEATPILLWRAALSWLGGLWTLVFAVAVLAPFGIGGITLIGSPLLQHEENAPLSSRLGRPLRLILPVYLMFSVLGIIALAAFGSSLVEAFCLALSAISTSGMSVHEQSLAELLTGGGQGVMALLCLIGSISVPMLMVLTLGREARSGFQLTELRVFLGLIIAYAAITILAVPNSGGISAFWQSISLHSTAGFNFLPDTGLANWPIVWVMLPVLIGGMALSTSGGVKVMRAIILAKDLGSELGKLSYPSSVHPLSLEGRPLQDRDFNAAWAYMAIFILFISLGVLLLGLFGTTLSDAWPIVLGALTNSLAITGHLDMPLGFAAMPDALQITIALLMIAGRIELLILMVLFTSSFWRYMR
jgi:trk system potassium uptake protein TrkH